MPITTQSTTPEQWVQDAYIEQGQLVELARELACDGELDCSYLWVADDCSTHEHEFSISTFAPGPAVRIQDGLRSWVGYEPGRVYEAHWMSPSGARLSAFMSPDDRWGRLVYKERGKPDPRYGDLFFRLTGETYGRSLFERRKALAAQADATVDQADQLRALASQLRESAREIEDQMHALDAQVPALRRGAQAPAEPELKPNEVRFLADLGLLEDEDLSS